MLRLSRSKEPEKTLFRLFCATDITHPNIWVSEVKQDRDLSLSLPAYIWELTVAQKKEAFAQAALTIHKLQQLGINWGVCEESVGVVSVDPVQVKLCVGWKQTSVNPVADLLRLMGLEVCADESLEQIANSLMPELTVGDPCVGRVLKLAVEKSALNAAWMIQLRGYPGGIHVMALCDSSLWVMGIEQMKREFLQLGDKQRRAIRDTAKGHVKQIVGYFEDCADCTALDLCQLEGDFRSLRIMSATLRYSRDGQELASLRSLTSESREFIEMLESKYQEDIEESLSDEAVAEIDAAIDRLTPDLCLRDYLPEFDRAVLSMKEDFKEIIEAELDLPDEQRQRAMHRLSCKFDQTILQSVSNKALAAALKFGSRKRKRED